MFEILIKQYLIDLKEMELFISDAQPEDTLSLALELFSNYVRAPQRNIVQLTRLSPGTL